MKRFIGILALQAKRRFIMAAKYQTAMDNSLQTNIQSEINFDPQIKSTDIHVATEDGVVTLTGFTHNYMEKIAAEKAAKRVYGVKAVANDIEVKLGNLRTDPEVARDIIQAFETNFLIPDKQLKVTVKGGWVTLEGIVEFFYEKNAAEIDVRKIRGVKGLSNKIEVKPTVSPVQVKAKIEEALRRSAEVDARRVTVEAKDSTVKLYGTVRSWAEKQDAEHAAWAAPGVAEVENHLKVMP
jgi:osmotically-inducible protein OsmY